MNVILNESLKHMSCMEIGGHKRKFSFTVEKLVRILQNDYGYEGACGYII